MLLGSACHTDAPGLGGSATSPEDTETEGATDSATGSTPDDTVDPDSSGGDDDWTEICDGSEGLRLAMVLGGGGLVANELERELGFYYLYVLGTCEYFALPAHANVPWPDAHRGVLDAETEEQLSRAIDYGHLADVAGSWGAADVADGSTLSVSDGTHTAHCQAGCGDGPPAVQALWSELGWIDALWEQGEPLDGAMRVSVIGWSDSTVDELGATWPLTVDPWSLALDGDVDPAPQAGDSILVEGADAQTLRELRQQYRTDTQPDGLINSLTAYGHLTFNDATGQDLFQLWMRDALPLENPHGLIPLP
ncbi:hypothetical protein OEB96_29745 [Paraliomyxa miuraensis]|nr:hypothetical protein [Paraliomyxa miuraensis]